MSGRKKILFISARLPYPAVEGHQIRAFGILQQLSLNFDVHLLSLLRDGESINKDNKLGMLCKSLVGVSVSTGFMSLLRAGTSGIIRNKPFVVTKYVTSQLKREFVTQLELVRPDIIHLDLLPLAGLIELIPDNVKIILNEHNLESDLIKQKIKTIASPLKKVIYQREYRTLLNFERSACGAADSVLACSDQDVIGIKSLGGGDVHCIPNGVDTKRLRPKNSSKKTKTLVFLGGMGWYPNRLGVIWFLNEVFPLILMRDPDIKLQLIGNPEPFINIPNSVVENVEILGFVDDFIPYVQNSTIMIVPLSLGSGTRLKVVEGLALGKCMVSTSKGAEGIGLTHGVDVIYADTAETFSSEIINVLNSNDTVSKIEINARNLACSVYDWDVIGMNLNKIYQAV